MKETKKSYRFDSLEEREALIKHFGEDYFKYIPTKEHERSGFLYHNHHRGWTSDSLNEYKNGPFYSDHRQQGVEIVLFKDAFPDYSQPCSYIGKNIQWKNDNPRKVIGFSEYEPDHFRSIAVNDYAFNNKNFIVLICEGNYSYPMCDKVTIVPDKPTSIAVKLNDSYEAVVTKDSIKVGCQTFPISILKELNEAAAKL